MKGNGNAEKLRSMRKKLHLTQNALAGKIFVARSTLTNYEVGRKRIPDYVIQKTEQLMQRQSA